MGGQGTLFGGARGGGRDSSGSTGAVVVVKTGFYPSTRGPLPLLPTHPKLKKRPERYKLQEARDVKLKGAPPKVHNQFMCANTIFYPETKERAERHSEMQKGVKTRLL